jgi:tetratricopeptide (TPR) repeat protein
MIRGTIHNTGLHPIWIILVLVLTTNQAEARRSRSPSPGASSQPAEERTNDAAPKQPSGPHEPAPKTPSASTEPPPSTAAQPAVETPSAGSAAGSQSAPPSKLNPADVDSTLAEATALFKAGQHEQAARKLLLVYEVSPQPILLFNAGQAFRRAKLPRDAKDCYVRFLEAVPQSPLGPEVRGYVRDMDTLIEMQRHEQEISLKLVQEQAAATDAQQALQKERSKPVYKRAWFWAVLDSVGVAAIAGLSFGAFVGSATQADVKADIRQ